jgi:hypothetical protein
VRGLEAPATKVAGSIQGSLQLDSRAEKLHRIIVMRGEPARVRPPARNFYSKQRNAESPLHGFNHPEAAEKIRTLGSVVQNSVFAASKLSILQ